MLTRYINIALCLLTVGSVMGCKHRLDPPDTPEEPASSKLALSYEIIDGLRVEKEVLNLPVLNMTIVKGDEAGNYAFDYSIDGGVDKTIKSLWVGKTISIGEDFKNNNVQGKHTVKGTLYNVDNDDEKVVVDTTVWIKYKIDEVKTPVFVTNERSVAVENNAVVYKGESGYLRIPYSPTNSVLPAKVVVPNNSPLKFDSSKAQSTNGYYTIPFSVTSTADVLLTIEISNGDPVRVDEYAIVCKEDSEGVTLGLELNAAPVSIWNEGLDLSMTIKDVNPRPYNIVYEIDGNIADAMTGKSVTGTLEHTVPTNNLREGEHTLSVTVSDAKNASVFVTKTTSFYHANLSISVDDNPMGKGEAFQLNTYTNYAFKPIGIPSEYFNLISISSTKNKDEISTASFSSTGTWGVKPISFGRGEIVLTINSGKGRQIRYAVTRMLEATVYFNVSENFVFSIGLDGTAPSGVTFSVSGNAEYVAQCDYQYAITEGAASDLHMNSSATRTDWPGSKGISLSIKAGETKSLVDLSDKFEEFSKKTYASEIWDPLKQNQKKSVNYPYYLAMSRLNVSVTAPYSLEDRDCIKLKSNVYWYYLVFSF